MSTNDQPPVETPSQDLAGKPDVASLAQAYRASSSEAQRLVNENNQLKQQLAQGYAPRQEIPQRPTSPGERLSDYGVPVDALDEYVEAKVQKRIQDAFAPVVQAAGARNKVISKRPEYIKYEAEVANFVGSDPELAQRYQAMFQGDPVGAIEWSIDRYAESQKGKVPEEQHTRRAAAEASIPTSRAAESRNTDSQHQEMLAEARKRAMTTGRKDDVERYAQLRFRQNITPEFYNTGHPGKR